MDRQVVNKDEQLKEAKRILTELVGIIKLLDQNELLHPARRATRQERIK